MAEARHYYGDKVVPQRSTSLSLRTTYITELTVLRTSGQFPLPGAASRRRPHFA